jgi:predicted DNA-binding transcriptional regulator AlpA
VTAQVDSGALAGDLRLLADIAVRLARHLEDGLAYLGGAEPHATVSPPSTASDLLEADELAALLKIDIRTLRRWRREDKVPKPLRGKGPLRWSRTAVETWLRERAS